MERADMIKFGRAVLAVLLVFLVTEGAVAQGGPRSLRASVGRAVDLVKPALVRIHVVETYYREGREMKFEASGSGVVITDDGYVITNHHVAGHAKQLKCTFADKSEVSAKLVGGDPLTDIAVIKLDNPDGHTYPVARFGDSAAVRVGDNVLAMGSPLSLSQSVTLGIVSNTEMIMPGFIGRRDKMEQDGEDVGALVRWIAHDAEIYPGNSGGPLVNMAGEVIGINEIKMGLSGAIPGNLAKTVAQALIASGKVRRAWLGVEVQPRLKHDSATSGILLGSAVKDSPADKAGLRSGDLLVKLGGKPIDVRFQEQIPDFNLFVSNLAIGTPVEAVVLRDGAEVSLMVTPEERQPVQPDQFELKPWGITVRDISFMMAKELKRDNSNGVLVTSVRPGGPAGAAKPEINRGDILVAVGGKPINGVDDLRAVTRALTKDAKDPVPTLTAFERKTGQFVTVVKVGTTELSDPGREVKKAWLPVDTQVLTRGIASLMDDDTLTGFRITKVYENSTADRAGLKVGDLILAVDGEKLTASAPEHYEELPALIRQYRPRDTVTLTVLRDGKRMPVDVELIRAPLSPREMKKYKNEDFEFTVRDVAFFDRATEQWKADQKGVLVEQVKSGSWAALGRLTQNDLIVAVDGKPVENVADMKERMAKVSAERPVSVVFKVRRGIHTFFIELEPKWGAE